MHLPRLQMPAWQGGRWKAPAMALCCHRTAAVRYQEVVWQHSTHLLAIWHTRPLLPDHPPLPCHRAGSACRSSWVPHKHGKEHPLPAFSLRTFPLRTECIPCLAFLLCSFGRFMPAKLQIAWRPLRALAVEHVKHGEPGVAKARGSDAATVNARTHSSTGQEFAASFKCKICQAVPRNHHLLPAATACNFIAGVAWCRHNDKALAIIGRALDVPTCEQQQRRDVRGGSVDGLI